MSVAELQELECEHLATETHTPAPDDLRAARAGLGMYAPMLALVCESRRGMKTAGAPSAPAVCSVCGQRRRPALADIIGPRRAWTVAMISSVSIPCR